MFAKDFKNQRSLEIILVLVTVGLTCLLHRTVGYKMIVLNLFYLPVVLAAFFLGRYRAGVLALFCVISASVVTAMNLMDFAAYTSLIVIGLAITLWGAVLGLTALLVGTLSDERSAKIIKLHEAHVGVVEVLSRYLQSANPKLKDRSNRVADLSEKVAQQMKLSEREVDDIRVAALLQDMENIEITAKVIRSAMGHLEEEYKSSQHTFYGTDLVHSLGAVLTGAFPLVLNQNNATPFGSPTDDKDHSSEVPFGARIIRTVRAYDTLTCDGIIPSDTTPREAIDELRSDTDANHHPAVLHALKRAVSQTKYAPQPAAAPELSERVEVEVSLASVGK